VTFWARRDETLFEITKCVTEVLDVIMQSATENTLITLTQLFFPDNLRAAGDEQVERCRQDVARIE